MTASLQRLPLDLASRWAEREVTTDPPRYVPHLEWDLWVRVTAPVPVRCAVVLDRPEEMLWGLVAREPEPDLELRVAFFPHAWSSSDAVHVHFEWQRCVVTDAALKEDPRSHVDSALPTTARTGELITVATIPSHDLRLAMIALVAADTETRRMGRWRVRPEFAANLPPGLADAATGHQRGQTNQQ